MFIVYTELYNGLIINKYTFMYTYIITFGKIVFFFNKHRFQLFTACNEI